MHECPGRVRVARYLGAALPLDEDPRQLLNELRLVLGGQGIGGIVRSIIGIAGDLLLELRSKFR
jgi:hypothetical protein